MSKEKITEKVADVTRETGGKGGGKSGVGGRGGERLTAKSVGTYLS